MRPLPFSYQIRRSSRATKTRLVVSPDKIEVVAPFNIAEKNLHQFVVSQHQWVLSVLKRIEKRSPSNQRLCPISYDHGAEIPYLGAFYPLVLRPTKLKKIKIDFSDRFTAFIPEALVREHISDAIKSALMRWMKKQVKQEVELIVQRHAPVRNLFPRAVAIKSQKTRWGSCGAYNNININWLLILAPPAVLEYVVVHELCHIQIKNHSQLFWDLVALHLPDFRHHRKWLKQHGYRLLQAF